MTANRVSYTLESSLEAVNQAERTAVKFAQQAGVDPDTTGHISMAVREAVVNAVLHGNKYDPSKKVRLAFERTDESLVITIQDEGRGVDLNCIPDPLAEDNLLKTSGRGIFLIRAFMDEVRFRDLAPGTEITLIKHVRGTPADDKESSQ